MAEHDGLECESVSVDVAEAGNISYVKLVVSRQDQTGAGIASVRRKIGAYYGGKNRTLRPMLKGNKEKVLFYSVPTAFVCDLASGQRKDGSWVE